MYTYTPAEIWPDNTSEIDVQESTGLDGTQTCGDLSLMPNSRQKIG